MPLIDVEELPFDEEVVLYSDHCEIKSAAGECLIRILSGDDGEG